MLCREGQISLVSFLSSIATSVSTSMLMLYCFKLDLISLGNFMIVFAAAAIVYVIHCAIALVFLAKSEYEVSTGGSNNVLTTNCN